MENNAVTKTNIPKSLNKHQMASNYGVTTKTLRNWINGNSELMKELTKTGYNKFTKVLTVHQVKLITHYLGNF